MKLLFSQKINNLVELDSFIKKTKDFLNKKCLLLLEGDLGSGKTTYVTQLLQSLGYTQASSPTYALHHSYKTKNLIVDHIDLYRLKDDQDIDSSGLWDIFNHTENLILIEWASRISILEWPYDWEKYYLKISKINDDQRKYDFYYIGDS